MISSTQIDTLGDRLRNAAIVDSDIRMLDEYRRSFGEAYETVVTTARDQLGLEPTGRPAKSTGSIIAKLERESIRLTQIQDIAGCLVVLTDVMEQDRVLDSLVTAFPAATVVDRRANSQFGYRAVHVIVPDEVKGSQQAREVEELVRRAREQIDRVVATAIRELETPGQRPT